jgi:hypothetical protein
MSSPRHNKFQKQINRYFKLGGSRKKRNKINILDFANKTANFMMFKKLPKLKFKHKKSKISPLIKVSAYDQSNKKILIEDDILNELSKCLVVLILI